MSEMGTCVCKKERGLCLCNRWEVTVYSDHGSLCVCVHVCAPVRVLISRETVLCVCVCGIKTILPRD